MTSKVDKKLFLSGNGRTVAVTGPITRWDSGETSAKFAVVIAQATDDGEILSAYAASDEVYRRGSAGWDAKASVKYDAPALTPGPRRRSPLRRFKTGTLSRRCTTGRCPSRCGSESAPPLIDKEADT
jgi:hypothetical protein